MSDPCCNYVPSFPRYILQHHVVLIPVAKTSEATFDFPFKVIFFVNLSLNDFRKNRLFELALSIGWPGKVKTDCRPLRLAFHRHLQCLLYSFCVYCALALQLFAAKLHLN